jgi:hypothetical protein
LKAVWMVIGLVPMSPNTTPSAPPKLQCKTGRSGLGSSRPRLRTPASAGHPSQSSLGRDSALQDHPDRSAPPPGRESPPDLAVTHYLYVHLVLGQQVRHQVHRGSGLRSQLTRAGRLGVGLEVSEAERGGDGVFPLDAPSEGFLVGGGRRVVPGWGVGRDRLISRQYCSSRTVMGITRVPPV